MVITTSTLILALIAFLTHVAHAQDIKLDAIHNATSLVGTWSSGSKAVTTGPGFANPTNLSFSYPRTTGISYSFTSDGFYEIARYRFIGNGSEPTCITGIMNWVHGTYTLNSNGSITTTPFGDGYQQIQDPCAAISNFLEHYNNTETYVQWRIFQDAVQGYKLHLYQFDGSPLAPQFLISTTPNILPTQSLRNLPKGNSPRSEVPRNVNKRIADDLSNGVSDSRLISTTALVLNILFWVVAGLVS